MTCYRALTNEELVTHWQAGKNEPELMGEMLHRFPEMVKIITAQDTRIEDLEMELESLQAEDD